MPLKVCENIANGRLNQGVFDMFMWEKLVFENVYLRLKAHNGSQEIRQIVNNEDWI